MAPDDPQEGQNEPQEGQSELREVPGGFRERFGEDFRSIGWRIPFLGCFSEPFFLFFEKMQHPHTNTMFF